MPATRTIERRINLAAVKRFLCPLEGCDVTVARKSDIPRHLDTHNPETKLNFPCPAECGSTFRQESNIRGHLKCCRAAAKARAKGLSFIRKKGGANATDISYVEEQLAEDSFTFIRYSGPKSVPVLEHSSSSPPIDGSSHSSLSLSPPPSSTRASEESIDAFSHSSSSLSPSPSPTCTSQEDAPSQPCPRPTLTPDEQSCSLSSDSITPNVFSDLTTLLELQPGSGLSGGLDYNAPPVPDMSTSSSHDVTPLNLVLENMSEKYPSAPQLVADPLLDQDFDSCGISNFWDELSLSGDFNFNSDIEFTDIDFSSFLVAPQL